MGIKKNNRKSFTKQIKSGKIGKLEAKRRKILEIKKRKKEEKLAKRNAEFMDKKNERETKVDNEGFFVLPEEFDLDQQDEDILNQFGTFSLSKDETSKEAVNFSISEMIQKLDDEINEKARNEIKEDMINDPIRNEKIRIVYTDVGKFLSKFRSGKIPKPIKVIPMLTNTFKILDITRPENWSPHAMYALTNMFVNTMTVDQLRIFLKKYLLPAVIKNIERYKKLNYQYFASLRRAFYKPAAWFRGILYPLAEMKITSRVATIVASVISSKSIPVIHSGISIIKMTQKPYNGPNNILLLSLINKKYSLPRSVLTAFFNWIMTFKNFEGTLPVLWFKTIFAFANNYQQHLTEEQKDDIKVLVKKTHKHYILSKEIVRKLANRGQSLNVTVMDDSRMVFEM